MHVSLYIYLYVYIYIYIYIERERETERCMYIYIYICVITNMNIYIYIYIYRRRRAGCGPGPRALSRGGVRGPSPRHPLHRSGFCEGLVASIPHFLRRGLPCSRGKLSQLSREKLSREEFLQRELSDSDSLSRGEEASGHEPGTRRGVQRCCTAACHASGFQTATLEHGFFLNNFTREGSWARMSKSVHSAFFGVCQTLGAESQSGNGRTYGRM